MDEAIALKRREAEAPAPAGAGDLKGVAGDLAAAFADDPVIDWLLRADARRPAALASLFRLIVDTSAGPGARIERPSSGGAAAIWLRNEDAPPPGFMAEMRSLGVLLGACGLARFGRAAKQRTAMATNHPKDRPHDYLSFLGVRPELQGRGLGSRLLAVHTARLDAEGRAAFLETGNPRTLPLYRSHGFEVTGDYRAAPDAPTMWALWREPRS